MKFLDEYRDPEAAKIFVRQIAKIVTKPWTLMEVCGGQTHSIVKYGIDTLLPDCVELVHGPGCPVCVTPIGIIDRAIELASRPDVIFCSFGDMLRVPGSKSDLLKVKSAGGDVRTVYSPLDAVSIALKNLEREVIFFAVGFETTAPSNALAVLQAKQLGLSNFSILVSHVLVPPAMEAILSSSSCRIQGFLAAGHVCAIMGLAEYVPIAERYHVPIVVTGFEPLDILQGALMCVKQLEEGRAEVENQYSRVVLQEGNALAQNMIQDVFEIVPRSWRGLGEIAQSGLGLRADYQQFDAEVRFGLSEPLVENPGICISGEVLQGLKKPSDCPAFGTLCTPESPLGAPMVSSEGSCAAYFRYRHHSRSSEKNYV